MRADTSISVKLNFASPLVAAELPPAAFKRADESKSKLLTEARQHSVRLAHQTIESRCAAMASPRNGPAPKMRTKRSTPARRVPTRLRGTPGSRLTRNYLACKVLCNVCYMIRSHAIRAGKQVPSPKHFPKLLNGKSSRDVSNAFARSSYYRASRTLNQQNARKS